MCARMQGSVTRPTLARNLSIQETANSNTIRNIQRFPGDKCYIVIHCNRSQDAHRPDSTKRPLPSPSSVGYSDSRRCHHTGRSAQAFLARPRGDEVTIYVRAPALFVLVHEECLAQSSSQPPVTETQGMKRLPRGNSSLTGIHNFDGDNPVYNISRCAAARAFGSYPPSSFTTRDRGRGPLPCRLCASLFLFVCRRVADFCDFSLCFSVPYMHDTLL